jgi:RND superfamily putative drug exporter
MESAQALRDLRAMGHGGTLDQLRVVLVLAPDSSVRRSAGWRALKRLDSALAADPRIDRVHSVVEFARAAGMGRSALAFLPDRITQGLVSQEGRFALVDVMPRESLSPEDLVALVRDLRRRGAMDAGLAGSKVLVGGLPAFNTDYRDAVVGRFGQVATLVVIGTLLALLVGTRSVLVPLKAVILNLLSVAAAFGAMTMVFQDGHGGRLFGVAEPLGAVFSTLPVVVFCMVFGLSMDYEVFLIARIIELKRAGEGNREAIVHGMMVTGPVITSAAAIMLAVFAAFALGDLLLVKMLGFALAVAVLLDATVVRMVIGPALLQLAGRWNWWPGMRGAQPIAPCPRTTPPAVISRT